MREDPVIKAARIKRARQDPAIQDAQNKKDREKRAAKNALLPTPPRIGRPVGDRKLGMIRMGYVLSVDLGGMACVIFSTSETVSVRTDGLPPVGAGDLVRVTQGAARFYDFAKGNSNVEAKECTEVLDAAHWHQHGECPFQLRLVLARIFSKVTSEERKCLREVALIRLEKHQALCSQNDCERSI